MQGKLDESIAKLEKTNIVFRLRTFMYRIFDKIIFESNLIFSIDLHEGSWISCFRAGESRLPWCYRRLSTSISQPLFVCVSVNCYCRELNQVGWKAKQATFSWISDCTMFIEIFPLFLYIHVHVHVSTDSTPGKTLLSFYCHISKSKYMECNKYSKCHPDSLL